MASLSIIRSGNYTSLQSRTLGGAFYGVSQGGPQDAISAAIANIVLGNSADHPVIECCFTAPSIEFNYEAAICITGADMEWRINDGMVAQNEIIKVRPHDILHGRSAKNGSKSYLAIQSENIDIIRAKQSNSFVHRNLLRKGDEISWMPRPDPKEQVSIKATASGKIEISEGPEYSWLSQEAKRKLVNNEFRISSVSDRIGVKLISSVLELIKSLTGSVPVLPGFIQLAPSGQLIVLNRDAQTTGGYPRIAFMNDKNLSVFNQLNRGEGLLFSWRQN